MLTLQVHYILAREQMRREKRVVCFFGSMLRSDTVDSFRAPTEECLEGADTYEEIQGWSLKRKLMDAM